MTLDTDNKQRNQQGHGETPPHREAEQYFDNNALLEALQEGDLARFDATSQYAACLMPLLQSVGWDGSTRELAEALPHYASSLDLEDLRDVMARLGFTSLERKTNTGDELDHRLLPCLFVTDHNDVFVLHSHDGIDAMGFSGVEKQYVQIPLRELRGYAYVIQPYDLSDVDEKDESDNWILSVLRRFKAHIWHLFRMTFVINIISLIAPFYIMAVYDQVIPAESINVLVGITIGALIALSSDIILRVFRSRMMAFLGARLEYTLSAAALGRVLSLPASMTEGASLGNQIARLKDFDSFRDMFTSVLFTVVLELPFVIMFMVIVGFLAGPIVYVPIFMVAIYAVLWFLMGPALQRTVRKASSIKAEIHAFTVETVIRLRTIKENRAEKIWQERYRTLSAEAAAAHKDTVIHSFMFQTASQSVIVISGLLTIVFGVLAVVNGDMTIGALIATMALIWRILSPIQNLFMTMARATQINVSIKQINALMRMQREDAGTKATKGFERKWRGALSLQRVSFRYNNITDPALLGISFTNLPGEMVGIVGANGSGKTTLLKLILGLYRPQAGQVSLDGVDIRQIPTKELRQTIAYLPQKIQLFHGTIAQNLRLSCPVSSDKQLRETCEMIGLLEEIEALEDGFETRIGDQDIQRLSSSFVQKLGLARTLLKETPIILLDEPAKSLDDESADLFLTALKKIKGSRTIIMVSHRPQDLQIADRIIVMNQGTLAAMGAPAAILNEIPEGML